MILLEFEYGMQITGLETIKQQTIAIYGCTAVCLCCTPVPSVTHSANVAAYADCYII